MKKNFSLVLVLILATAMFSCTNDVTELETTKTEVSIDEISTYHNIAVRLYEQSKSNKKSEKSNIIEIQNSVTDLMIENYPQIMNDFIVPENFNFLISNYITRTSNEENFDFNLFLNEGLSTLVEENKISQNFSNSIMSLTLSSLAVADKVIEINNLRDGSLNSNENDFLIVYESTLEASNEYWSNSNSSAGRAARLNCSSQVVAADAVGAGLGLFGSPVWSIIQGAVVSIAVSEDCEDEEEVEEAD